MTITSARYVEPGLGSEDTNSKKAQRSDSLVWHAVGAPFKGYQVAPSEGYQRSSGDTAIVIDNGWGSRSVIFKSQCANCVEGSSAVRAGWSFDSAPRLSFPADVARYRDRKLNRTVSYVGYDAYADATTRGQIRNAFEPGTSVVGNWDVMEGILDHIFVNLGIDGDDGGIGRPVLMTEPVANLGYSRKSWYQCLACMTLLICSSNERDSI